MWAEWQSVQVAATAKPLCSSPVAWMLIVDWSTVRGCGPRLIRSRLGRGVVGEGRAHEFRRAAVARYEGGWTSVSIAGGGGAALAEDVVVPQDEAYIERTFKILSGIQRKKGRQEGRLPPWEHPEKRDGGRE